MGAIIGGLFAAGYSGDRLKAVAHDLSLNKYVEHLRPSFLKKDPQGVFNYLLFIDSKNRLLRRMGLVREDAFKAFLKGLVGARPGIGALGTGPATADPGAPLPW
jgi:predicted acylesterase/phospholipase RssA